MLQEFFKNLNINIKNDDVKININENGLNVKVLSDKGKKRESQNKIDNRKKQGKTTGKKIVNKGELTK
jgi:hypothetical protein